MEIVELGETVVVGIEVVADFSQLLSEMPAAWCELFSRQDELPASDTGVFVEASDHLGDGRYREIIGAVAVVADIPVPDGMAVTLLPAGRFVHHRHDGTVATIAGGFQAIYDWAAEQGLTLGNRKFDVGYTADGVQQPHELYIDILS
jgi:predicted transcriptional regulator YdeE